MSQHEQAFRSTGVPFRRAPALLSESGCMKTFFACLVSVLAATGANYFLIRHELEANAQPGDESQLNARLDELNASVDRMKTILLAKTAVSAKPRQEQAPPADIAASLEEINDGI